MTRHTLCVAACLGALSPAVAHPQLTPPMDPIEVGSRWMGKTVLLDTLATWNPVPGTRAQTYSAVLRVLQHHLKLPVETADSTRGVVFNKRVVVRGKLAEKPVSRWLRCGTGMVGDFADTWRVTLAYAVYVDSTPSGASRLGVALFATASDVAGVSKPPAMCTTTGALEAEITRLVRTVTVVGE